MVDEQQYMENIRRWMNSLADETDLVERQDWSLGNKKAWTLTDEGWEVRQVGELRYVGRSPRRIVASLGEPSPSDSHCLHFS